MLPLLSLGNSHQNSFVSLSARSEVYQNNNPALPLSSSTPSQSADGFAGILHSTSLESTTEETFHTIPSSLGMEVVFGLF